MKFSLPRLHKTFVGQNLIIFVVSLVCAFLSTFALQYMLIDRSILNEKQAKLIEWNRDFLAHPAVTLRDGFAVINFLVDTSYPAVAINFNMAEQMFPRVRAISVKQDDLGIILLNSNKHIIGADKVEPLIANKIALQIENAPPTCPYWFVFLSDHAAFIKAVREKPGTDPIGYVVGVRPRKALLAVVEGEYFRIARQFEEFSPKIEFNSAVANGVICPDSTHILNASFSETPTRMFPIHWEVILVLLVVFILIVLISSRILKRSLSQPLHQLQELVRFVGDSPDKDFPGIMPADPMFRYIAEEIIHSSKKRVLLENVMKSQERNKAIARTTQMLAHDVRKPFSMLQMTFEIIRNSKSIDEIKNIAEVAFPDIQRATTAVNGLIQDVMEVSSGSSLYLEQVRAETLVEAAINDVFQVHQTANVALAYNFAHTSTVFADSVKIGRVFSNILSNAVQAMSGEGQLWINTEMVFEKGMRFVQFTLGNSDSLIEPDDLKRLFEDFFTKGKKGGTGLGLAISEKIVTEHGGRIWCESSSDEIFPTGKVEFKFLLPANADVINPANIDLPKSSAEIIESLEFLKLLAAEIPTNEDDTNESRLENEIVQFTKKLGRKLNILLVDDENIYRNALLAHLEKSNEVKRSVSTISAASGSEAMSALNEVYPDLIIMDVDLGDSSKSGFDVVADMRREGYAGFICIHSNRILATDYKTAIDKGADSFLPKPMSSQHLLKLLCQAAEKKLSTGKTSNTEQIKKDDKTLSDSKRRFIFIEDSEMTRALWTLKWPQGELTCFKTPEEFLDLLSQDASFIKTISCIISDFDFGGQSRFDGKDLVQKLRGMEIKIPIIISTDGMYSVKDFNGLIDAVIPKSVPTKEFLDEILAEDGSIKS